MASDSLEIVGSILLLLILYKYLIQPAFLSPLSRIPHAHFTSSFSDGWIKWQRFNGKENRAIHDAHQRLGPIVRLGSSEISVNSVEGLKAVYSDGFDKHEWYGRAFANYGQLNMFSTIHKRPHGERRRLLVGLYSKTTVQSSTDFRKIAQTLIIDRLLPVVEAAAREQNPVDVLGLNLAVSMDFISAYLFGLHNSSNFLQNVDSRQRWLSVHQSSKENGFWSLEFPALTSFLSKLGIHLVPPRAISAGEEVKDLCLKMLANVESSTSTFLQAAQGLQLTDGDNSYTKPVVYDQLFRQLRPILLKTSSSPFPETSSEVRLSIASELMDNLTAGTETSGWTLTYIMHELSMHPDLQFSLRSELRSIADPIIYSSSIFHSELPALRSMDALPLLEAIILETLRLHPAVPGPQPRVTPSTISRPPISLGGYANIPAGIRISAQAYSLHRNADVFPEPEVWRPERWLQASKEEKDEMMRWFWAFGSGGKMCIGSHFAMSEIRLIVAGIYTTYTTKIIDDEGIEQMDGYSTGPKGNKLILQFARVETS